MPRREVCADFPMPTVVSVLLRATAPVPTLTTVQFFNVFDNGDVTPAGTLSMPPEEFDSPAWQRIRAAAGDDEDLRGHT